MVANRYEAGNRRSLVIVLRYTVSFDQMIERRRREEGRYIVTTDTHTDRHSQTDKWRERADPAGKQVCRTFKSEVKKTQTEQITRVEK